MTSDQRKIIESWVRLAIKQGWTLIPSGNRTRHWKLRAPSGEMIVLPCSPNGHPDGLKHGRAKLRRAGLRLDR